jgi:hypothetical protein
VGVLAETLGAACGDAEVVAMVALGEADGCVEAVGETLKIGVASGDAGAAMLVALGEGEASAGTLGIGVVTATELTAGKGETTALGIAVGMAGLGAPTGSPEGLGIGPSAVNAAPQIAAWVALSSPLPKMLAWTAAATLEAERTMTIATAAARDRFPCLGSSTMFPVRRCICFRLAALFLFAQALERLTGGRSLRTGLRLHQRQRSRHWL